MSDFYILYQARDVTPGYVTTLKRKMAAILRATVVAACLSSVLSFALNSAPILGQRCSTAGAACVSRPGLRAAVVQRNRAGGPRDPIRAGAR